MRNLLSTTAILLLLSGCGTVEKNRLDARPEETFTPPTGGLVVTANASGSLSVLDNANRGTLYVITIPGSPQDVLGLENGSEVLVSIRTLESGKDGLARVDVRTKDVKDRIPFELENSLGRMALAPDKVRVAVIATESAEVLLVDLSKKAIVLRISFAGETLRDVEWLNNGRIAVAAGNAVRTVNEDGSEPRAIPLAGPVVGLGTTVAGGRLYAVVSKPPQFVTIDGGTAMIKDLAGAAGPAALALSKDGMQVMVADGGLTTSAGVSVFRFALNGEPTKIAVGSEPRAILVDGGDLTWIANTASATVTVLNADGSFGVELPVGRDPVAIAKISAPGR